MNHRGRDIDTLFQRITPTAAATADPMTVIDAARAVDEWPLLAMLTPPLPAAARTPHHMMMPVEETAPLTAVTRAADPAPDPEPTFELQPEVPGPTDEAQLSPLEQLFRRAERTGKPQTAQPSVFAPAEQMSAPLSAPPPLKVPSQRRPTPTMARPVAAVAVGPRAAPTGEGAMTLEPRAKEWHTPDMVPQHLFERVGGC